MSVEVPILVRATVAALGAGALLAVVVLAVVVVDRAAEAIRIVGGTGALPRACRSRRLRSLPLAVAAALA